MMKLINALGQTQVANMPSESPSQWGQQKTLEVGATVKDTPTAMGVFLPPKSPLLPFKTTSLHEAEF